MVTDWIEEQLEWMEKFPTQWPQTQRRIFVLLFPVMIPLWAACWAVVAVCFFALGVFFIGAFLVSSPPALIWAVWKGSSPNDIWDAVEHFWTDVWKGLTRFYYHSKVVICLFQDHDWRSVDDFKMQCRRCKDKGRIL